jgi:Tol biopolymer transport system component
MKRITPLILLIFISLTLMISIGCSIFGGSSKSTIISGGTGGGGTGGGGTGGGGTGGGGTGGGGTGGGGTSPQYKIVFLKQVGTQAEIYTMNIDGTNPTRLTNSPQDKDAPMWSPVPIGGVYKISFLKETSNNIFNIFTIDADGSNEQQITTSGVSFSFPAFWSPDGTKLLFVKNNDIYVINADGTNEQNLTYSSTPEIFATWSPNGKIAYSGVSQVSNTFDIFLGEIDSNGNFNITNLTNTSNNEDEFLPTWSPDGNKILFLKRFGPNIGDPVDVWEIDISQQPYNLRRLTSFSNIDESWPALYSPDGTKILFLRNGDIYVIDDLNNPNPRNLTNSTEREFFAIWTPDGRILFVRDMGGGNGDIFIVNPNDSTPSPQNLTQSPESESAPICSPVQLP